MAAIRTDTFFVTSVPRVPIAAKAGAKRISQRTKFEPACYMTASGG
jgi:hypothetical protein